MKSEKHLLTQLLSVFLISGFAFGQTTLLTEGFEGVTTYACPSAWSCSNGATVPAGWAIDGGEYWCSQSAGGRTAAKCEQIRYAWRGKIWTSGVSLTAGVAYTFSYWYKNTTADAGFTMNSGVSTVCAGAVTAIGAATVVGTSTTWTQKTGTFTPGATGTYYFCIWNSNTSTVPWYLNIDDVLLVDPCTAPSITTQPNSPSICNGGTANLSVTAGGTTLTYQWQSMATNCATPTNVGTNSSSYTTAALSTGTYYYRCYISNSCGNVTSNCGTVTVQNISTTPVVTSPICPSATSVSGTNTEVDGTTITVYKGGVSQGTTTVTTNAWTKSGLTALVAGDIITATATAAGKCVSALSTSVTVAISATPVVTSPICPGATSVSGTSTEANGTTITVYKGGVSQGTTTVTANAWTISGLTALIAGDAITAMASATGKCSSAVSSSVTVAISATPVVTSPICAGSTSVSGTSTEANGTIITVYKGGVSQGTTTVTANAWTKSGLAALVAGDIITATATATGKCVSSLSASVTVQSTSATPVVTSPICPGATSVSGTNTEADGTTITVYKGGVSQGTTTVTTNAWTKSGLAALVAGDVITATSAATGKCVSAVSSSVTVAVSATPVVTSPICSGATSVSGTSTEANGTTITVYKGGVSQGTTTVTANAWTKSGLTALVASDVITATATAAGKCVSALSASVTVQSISATPAVSSPICPGATSVSGTSTEANGTTITAYKGGVSQGTTTVTANAWTKSGLTALVAGDVITSTATATGKCVSALSASVTVQSTSATPVVASPICPGATSVSGTSTEANGTTITVYKGGVSQGTTTVTANAWTITGLTALIAGNVITATATATGKCVSALSSSVTVQSTSATPVVTSLICAGATSVSGTSTEANGTTINVYKGGVSQGTTTVTTNAWTITGLTALVAGDVITATATATGKCVSTLSASEIVNATPTGQATTFSSSAITSATMTIGWVRGNGNNVLVIAKAGSAPTDPVCGSSYTGNAAYGSGTAVGGGFAVYNGTGTSVNLTTLSAGTIYYFAFYEYNTTATCYYLTELTGNATTLVDNMITLVDPATDGGFENATSTFAANGWTVVNGTTNQWIVGTSAYNAGAKGAYISNDGALNDDYSNVFSTSHFYRDITVPNIAGIDHVSVLFSLKGQGESGWDRLLVYTAPTTITPSANSPVANSTTITGATLRYAQELSCCWNGFTSQSFTFVVVPGSTYRIIFTWQNDDGIRNNPPAALDDIEIIAHKYENSNGVATDNGIHRITFAGICFTNNTQYNGYTFYNTLAYIQPGQTYNLDVKINTGGPWYSAQMAWIDWNQDGDFDDAGESYNLGGVYDRTEASNSSSANCPLPITVPGGAFVGKTMMRVSSKSYFAGYQYPTAYEIGFDGEVEDYMLTVGTPPAPTLTGATPNPICGYSNITITGTNLRCASSVTIGGTSVLAIVSNSATQIVATVANGTTGIVSVTTSGGTATTGPITVAPYPTGNAGPDIAVCTGLAATPMTGSTQGGTISGNNWTGGGGLGSWTQNADPALATFTPSVGGGSFIATLTVTGSGACAGSNPSSTRRITWGTSNANYKTWYGITNTNWGTASNWCDAVPTSTTDVLIPSGMPNAPTINVATASCRSLTINSGQTLTNSGTNTLEIYGDYANNGTFTPATGTVDFKGAGAQGLNGTLNFYNLNFTTNTVKTANASTTVSNDLTINSGATLNSGSAISVANNLNITAGANTNAAIAVTNNLTINSGTFAAGTSTISIGGNWVNNSAFTTNTSGITFNGTAAKSIGGTASSTFNNLTINKTGTTGNDVITLSQPTIVNGTLTLTDGIINSSSNLLTIASSGTTTGGVGSPTNSFVSGPIRWNGRNGAGPFIFPTGKGSKWARVAIAGVSALSDFQTEYFNTGYSTATPVTAPVVALSSLEYWDLTKVSGGTASVRLYWEDATASGIASCAANGDLVVGHYTGGTWISEGSPIVSGACTGTAAGYVESASGISTFSPFTFATKNGWANPLPIELAYFSAVCKDEIAYINWTTATETNNDFYTLERSLDGLNFSLVATIRGAGSSTTMLNYEYIDLIDNVSKESVVYYRLKQTDFDGKYKYSDIIATKCLGPEFELITIMPNPTHSNFTVFYNSPFNKETVTIEVRDMIGRIIQSADGLTKIGGNTMNMDISDAAPGVYFVILRNRNTSFIEKVIKN